MDTFDILTHACHKAASLPDGWQGNIFKRVGSYPNSQGLLITGAVSPVRTRGPRKGEPNWPKRDRSTEREVYVSNAAFEEAKAEVIQAIAVKP